jgi:acyl-CoA thioester hydrolase
MARVKLQIPTSLPFRTKIPLRISDINYGGHLGNDAVLSIIHEARLQFLKSLGYTELEIEGTALMMTDVIIVYTSEGFYGDVLAVEVGATDFQSAQCDFVFRLKNMITDKEVARAKTGIVFLNNQTHKISRLPSIFRKKCDATGT